MYLAYPAEKVDVVEVVTTASKEYTNVFSEIRYNPNDDMVVLVVHDRDELFNMMCMDPEFNKTFLDPKLVH